MLAQRNDAPLFAARKAAARTKRILCAFWLDELNKIPSRWFLPIFMFSAAMLMLEFNTDARFILL